LKPSDPEAAKILPTVQETGKITSYETASLTTETREPCLFDDGNISTTSQAMSLEDTWSSLGLYELDPNLTLLGNTPIATEATEMPSPPIGGNTMPTSETLQKGKKILKPSPGENCLQEVDPTTIDIYVDGVLTQFPTSVLNECFPNTQFSAYDSTYAQYVIETLPEKPEVPDMTPDTKYEAWSENTFDEEMQVVDPRVAEGIDSESSSEETTEMELDVIQVSPGPIESCWSLGQEAPSPNTEVEANGSIEIPSDSCDLLEMVLNDTVGPASERFLEFVKVEETVKVEPQRFETLDLAAITGPSTSSTEFQFKVEPREEGEADHVTIVKRPRGRPRLPKPEVEPPRRPRGRPPTAPTRALLDDDSSSAVSAEDQKAHKYRRMRNLNNAASKRCRLNRKRKMDNMEVEEEILTSKNLRLQTEVQQLEEKVEQFKNAIFKLVAEKKNKKAAASTIVKQEEPSVSQEPSIPSIPEFNFDLNMFN